MEEKNNFRQVFIVHKQQQSRRSLLQRKNILLTLVSSRLCQELERYLGIWLGSAWKHALCIYGPSGWSQIDKKKLVHFQNKNFSSFCHWQTSMANLQGLKQTRQDYQINTCIAILGPQRYTTTTVYKSKKYLQTEKKLSWPVEALFIIVQTLFRNPY